MEYEYDGKKYYVEDLEEEKNIMPEEELKDTLDLTDKLKNLKNNLEDTMEIKLDEVKENE